MKEQLRVLKNVKTGNFNVASNRVKGTWIFLKKDKFTPTYINQSINNQKVNELNGKTQIKIPQGKLLYGF